ncbi:MAG: flagellar basal body rod protein FlgB [Aeromonadaceae bacterium]
MAISFDKAFGIHQYTIGARAQRAEVLSTNIANADTPGYKAQDLDFSAALQQAQSGQSFGLALTNEHHIRSDVRSGGALKFRVPNQADTGDGNTVDIQQERSSFLENGLQYQASLEFLNSRISGLMKALKGDQA